MRVLTPRQRQVMLRVAFGLSNEDIAEDLGCAEATVKTHVQDSLDRLHAENRAHAIGLLYRTGWPA